MFKCHDLQNIKDSFFENGYVVVTDVLNESQINNTIDEIFQHTALLGDYGIKYDDPTTWHKFDQDGIIGSKGFLDLKASTLQTQLKSVWENRQNPNVVKVFQEILGNKDILLHVDRLNLMKPTKNNPEWKTDPVWLHWDQNPWSEPEFRGVQGLITLTDHTEDSGGFCCVPKFTHKFGEWGKCNMDYKEQDFNALGAIVFVPKDDPLQKQVKKILAPAGSLIIWDSRSPHSNYPNTGDAFRIAQYITFEKKENARDDLLQVLTQVYFESKVITDSGLEEILTPLGREITNFDKYQQEYPVAEKDVRGWDRYQEATMQELDGDIIQAIKSYSSARKLSRFISEHYL